MSSRSFKFLLGQGSLYWYNIEHKAVHSCYFTQVYTWVSRTCLVFFNLAWHPQAGAFKCIVAQDINHLEPEHENNSFSETCYILLPAPVIAEIISFTNFCLLIASHDDWTKWNLIFFFFHKKVTISESRWQAANV